MNRKVGIAFSVASFCVREVSMLGAVRFLFPNRQRPECFGKKSDTSDMHRGLTSSRLEHETLQSDMVTQVQEFDQLITVLAQLVTANVELHRARLILNVPERCLPMRTQSH
jgi:hypothetical protein